MKQHALNPENVLTYCGLKNPGIGMYNDFKNTNCIKCVKFAAGTENKWPHVTKRLLELTYQQDFDKLINE